LLKESLNSLNSFFLSCFSLAKSLIYYANWLSFLANLPFNSFDSILLSYFALERLSIAWASWLSFFFNESCNSLFSLSSLVIFLPCLSTWVYKSLIACSFSSFSFIILSLLLEFYWFSILCFSIAFLKLSFILVFSCRYSLRSYYSLMFS